MTRFVDDVIVVGAGPAGAVAATVLARAGARVRLLDRATFPRDKMCGDTINPGTRAILRRLHTIDGMRISGDDVAVEARYPDGQHGLAQLRRHFDHQLVQQSVRAGAAFEPG